MKLRLFFTMNSLVFIAAVGGAAEISVPGTAATIQAAVDMAAEGDTVIVAPGTYFERVVLSGANIRLRSTNPENPAVVAATVLDGQSSGTVLTFAGNEQAVTVVSGLTIRNGLSNTGGGGIEGNYTSATVERCRIVENVGYSAGGVFQVYGALRNNVIHNNRSRTGGGLGWCRTGEISGNEITSNSAISLGHFDYTARGGGLAYCQGTVARNIISGNLSTGNGGGLYGCTGQIRQNDVTSNTAWRDGGGLFFCIGPIDGNTISFNNAGASYPAPGGSGGGISGSFEITNNLIYANTTANAGGGIDGSNHIYNNTIFGNAAWLGGGVHATYYFRNNIVWGNTAVVESQASSSSAQYCCIQGWGGGGAGNISGDPQFANAAGFDFRVALTSPCVDAGGLVPVPADFEQNCRPARQTTAPGGDGTGYDIGAFEYPGLCAARMWDLFF